MGVCARRRVSDGSPDPRFHPGGGWDRRIFFALLSNRGIRTNVEAVPMSPRADQRRCWLSLR